MKPVAGPKHYRNGPEMDVAMCGVRGASLPFSRSRGGITCADCSARLDRSIAGKRNRREFLARVRAGT